jgi:cell division protein ZapE
LPNSIQSKYQTLIADQHLNADAAQATMVQELGVLAVRLQQHRLSRKSSALGWLFARKASSEPLKGLYIHGEVGRGKTMLMDLFFESLDIKRKRRAHFHSFMADVHGRIHAWRQLSREGKAKGNDPIEAVAEQLAIEAWVLCFDEFSVTDIADAMILGRLFSALWLKGVVVVATSNVEPDSLYRNGLNRALFLPFVAQLRGHMSVLSLQAKTDYRREKIGAGALYFCPADKYAECEIDKIWQRLTLSHKAAPATVHVNGRNVDVSQASDGAARFEFEDLCTKPLGAADYLEISRQFHTVIVEYIPVMTLARRNEAKRFITLIDVLYENNVKLIMSADAPVEQLYNSREGFEVFEFERTVSRLIEMRSEEYLAQPHGSKDSEATGETTGLVET